MEEGFHGIGKTLYSKTSGHTAFRVQQKNHLLRQGRQRDKNAQSEKLLSDSRDRLTLLNGLMNAADFAVTGRINRLFFGDRHRFRCRSPPLLNLIFNIQKKRRICHVAEK